MKVETKREEPVFSPIELKITIESKRELEFLWAIFNANEMVLTDLANDTLPIGMREFYEKEVETQDLWKKLDKILNTIDI